MILTGEQSQRKVIEHRKNIFVKQKLDDHIQLQSINRGKVKKILKICVVSIAI